MNRNATELEKRTAVSDFAYTLDMIPLSLYNGNTNLIGRNAWNGLIGEIVKGVSNYVNQLNLEFRNDPNNPSNTVNPNDHPRFLHEDVPTLVNTRVRNNNFHISIGLVTSSLDSHDVVNAHNAALGDAVVLEDVPIPSDSYVPRQKNMGAGPGPGISTQQVESAMGVLHGTQPPPPVGGARPKVQFHPQQMHHQLVHIEVHATDLHLCQNKHLLNKKKFIISRQKNCCILSHPPWKNPTGTPVKDLERTPVSCPT